MIYDGVDLSDYMQTYCVRPLMASPSVSTFSAAGSDGFEVTSVVLESVEVPVRCLVLPESPLTVQDGIMDADTAKREIASLLFRRKKCPLVFDEDQTKYTMAVLASVGDVERTAYADTFDIAFKCEPFFRSREPSVALSGTKTIEVNGTLPTPATITVKATGAASSIKVTNVNTLEYVQVNTPFSSGAVLVIDTEKKIATVNGAYTPVTLGSDFFDLSPGSNTLKLSAFSGVVEYEGRWL